MNTSANSTESQSLSALRSRPVAAVVIMVSLASALQMLPRWSSLHLIGRRNNWSFLSHEVMGQPQRMIGEAKLAEESNNQGERNSQIGTSHSPMQGVLPIATGDTGGSEFSDTKPPPVHIEDAADQGMKHFYAALKSTAARQGSATTRIVHFGDSLVASDYVSGTLRRLLQRTFGDAGHGFTLVANAWPSYFHEGVSRFATSGWLVSRVVGPYTSDGWYGLGGVSFKAPPNTLLRIGTAKRGEIGRTVSRFELAYVADPNGGSMRVRIDEKVVGELSTQNPEKQFKTAEWKVPEGPHELELLTTHGTSRLFGVILERDVPGVVLDAIGIQGARLRFLDQQDDAHYAAQLRWRNPDLVIYEFGANESADGLAYSLADFHSTMKKVLLQQKSAISQASCLVVGAMDRAVRSGDSLTSAPFIPLLVKEQRAVAQEVGCAFFDTYQAMGGPGAMPRWVHRGLGQADLTHPTAVGADIIGTWLYRAVMEHMH
jgi:lysophospholipase L1-like esterase